MTNDFKKMAAMGIAFDGGLINIRFSEDMKIVGTHPVSKKDISFCVVPKANYTKNGVIIPVTDCDKLVLYRPEKAHSGTKGSIVVMNKPLLASMVCNYSEMHGDNVILSIPIETNKANV